MGWFEYWESHEVLNKDNSNKFSADKFIKFDNEIIMIITDKYFNYCLKDLKLMKSDVHMGVLAIMNLQSFIQKNFSFYQFYHGLSTAFKDWYCKSEFEAIKLYYTHLRFRLATTVIKDFKKTQ